MMKTKTHQTIQKLSSQYIQKRAFSTGNAMNRLTSHGTIQLPTIVNEPMVCCVHPRWINPQTIIIVKIIQS